MKIVDRDIILSSNEVVKFPNSQISDTGSLEITGSISIDATQIKGIEVDMTTLADQGILTYDSTSGMLIFAGGVPPTPPPSGTTRGVWGGGYDADAHTYAVMDYVTIASTGNAANFGNLSQSRANNHSASNATNDRGVWTGGAIEVAGPDWIAVDTIDYHAISTTGNATDFGNLVYELYGASTTSNATNERAVTGGGQNYTDDPGDIGQILLTSYFTINSTGNATEFGDGLTAVRNNAYATSNWENERAIFGPGANWPTLDYLTINTLSNGATFGDLIALCLDQISYDYPRSNSCGNSNGTNERGVFGGGYTYCRTIDYITINSTGNATYFGDLTATPYGANYGRGYIAGTSSGGGERGLFGGGLYYTSPYVLNIIDYITINSISDATDFGDLTTSREEFGACSG